MWISLPNVSDILDYVSQFAGPFGPVVGLLLASVVLEHLLAALDDFLEGGGSSFDKKADKFNARYSVRQYRHFGKQFSDDGW